MTTVKFKTRKGELIEVSGIGSKKQLIQLFDVFQREKTRIEQILGMDCQKIKGEFGKRNIILKDLNIRILNNLGPSEYKNRHICGTYHIAIIKNGITFEIHPLIDFSIKTKKIEPSVRRHEITHYLFELSIIESYGLSPYETNVQKRYKNDKFMYNEGFARVVSKLPEFGEPMITSAPIGSIEKTGFELVKALWEEIRDIKKVLDVIISRLDPSNY